MSQVTSAEIYSGAEVNVPLSQGKFAMWLFLATEIMFFAGVLGTYVVLRQGNPGLFLDHQKDLLWYFAAINTVILITSSLTMVLAVAAVPKGETMKVAGFLTITAILGCLFLALKLFEYNFKFEQGIGPWSDTFYACYFVSTGLHGVHVLAGVVMILIFALKAFFGGLPRDTESVELVGLYWHFVDLVWIYLFPLVYLF